MVSLNFEGESLEPKTTGLSDFRVTLLVAVPNLLGFIAMQLNGWHSDRTAERRWHTAIPLFVTAASLLVLSLAQWGAAPSLVLFSIAAASLLAFCPASGPCRPPFSAIPRRRLLPAQLTVLLRALAGFSAQL